MKWNSMTRRHFLEGPGKATLVLPFLPSLLPRTAGAQASAAQKSFIAFPLFNGIMHAHNMNEQEAAKQPSIYMPAFKNMATVNASPYNVRQKTLTAAKADGGGRVSEVIDEGFNPYLGKMLMLQGLDHVSAIGHHLGHLGNSASHEGAVPEPQMAACIEPQATLDQVLAYSDSFCKSAAVKGKSLYWINNDFEARYGQYVSHTFVDPNNKKTSAITKTSVVTSANTVWSKYFDPSIFTPPAGTGTGKTQKQLLVDKVLLDYQSARGSSRLGAEDKKVMDRHIELLYGTQKGLMSAPMRTCAAPAKPNAPAAPAGYDQLKAAFQTMNSVVVALIACGMMHSFVGQSRALVTNDIDSWHAWSHASDGANAAWVSQKGMMKAVMKEYVLDMVAKLDAAGLLDSSLVMVVDEHQYPHQAWDMNIVTFGSAGGVLKTDQYIDYRNPFSNTAQPLSRGQHGWPVNQAYSTILQAMGMPVGEIEGLQRTKFEPNFFSPINSGYSANMLGKYTWNIPEYARFKGHNLSNWLPLTKA